MSQYDIVINGGGIVGLTLLNLLTKSKYLKCRVLLLENLPNLITTSRVSSISASSNKLLNKIGVDIKQFSNPVNHMKVWNYDYHKQLTFESKNPTFYVAKNDQLASRLLDSIDKSKRDCISWSSTLTSLNISQEEKLFQVTATNNQGEEFQVSTKLVIGCDGFKSKVRSLANFNYKEIDLQQSAIVGTVRLSPNTSNKHVAYQRFSLENDTVVALLPLTKDLSSFVISCPQHHAGRLMLYSNEEFVEYFNRLLSKSEYPLETPLKYIHIMSNLIFSSLESKFCSKTSSRIWDQDEYLGSPEVSDLVEGSRVSFPLWYGVTSPKMVTNLKNDCHAAVALVGDSCHRIHPLAGQGLNFGIGDAEELVAQLENVSSYGEDPFRNDSQQILNGCLNKYECNRQKYLIPMQSAIYYMPTFFKLLPKEFLSIGNRLEGIKKLSMNYAGG